MAAAGASGPKRTNSEPCAWTPRSAFTAALPLIHRHALRMLCPSSPRSCSSENKQNQAKLHQALWFRQCYRQLPEPPQPLIEGSLLSLALASPRRSTSTRPGPRSPGTVGEGVPDASASDVRRQRPREEEWWQLEGQVGAGQVEARGAEEEAALRLLRLLLYAESPCEQQDQGAARAEEGVEEVVGARGAVEADMALREEVRETLHGICLIVERHWQEADPDGRSVSAFVTGWVRAQGVECAVLLAAQCRGPCVYFRRKLFAR